MKRLVLLLSLLCLSSISWAKVKLPAVLSDNMVLQRESNVNLWGSAAADAKIFVTTSWDGKEYVANADKQGEWLLKVVTPQAGGAYTITISDGEPLIISNVVIGDVWICSGQSNMEMPLKGWPSQPCNNSVQMILTADKYPNIRLFKISRAAAEHPRRDCSAEWKTSSMESASEFSAAGYFFGRGLADVLNIPLGLIDTSWGGTRIEAWMSRETALKSDKTILDDDNKQSGPNKVASLYNGMIAPITNFTAKGFVWYQGESNRDKAYKYADDMVNMVEQWRTEWGDEKMPFYYVQIAPFDYNRKEHLINGKQDNLSGPLVVEAQIKALDRIPYSGIAGTSDMGHYYHIHPPQKDLVGQRLAILALTKCYGRGGIDSQGPMFESMQIEDDRAIVSFASPSGLTPINEEIMGFEIAGKDRVFHPAEAQLHGDGYMFESRKVCVRSDKVSQPIAVRYAFKNLVEVNLCNGFGMPAFPFRTDSWNDVNM